MELSFDINKRRKQFTGIGRDHLCDFKDGIQYLYLYPVRDGLLENITIIAQLFSFSEKKLLKSETIVVPLLTVSEFRLYYLTTIKSLIFNELKELRNYLYSCFMLDYAGTPSLAKL